VPIDVIKTKIQLEPEKYNINNNRGGGGGRGGDDGGGGLGEMRWLNKGWIHTLE
jgi:hypothetical protein